jgi:WD40 repeat protein
MAEDLSKRVIKGYELRELIGEGGFGAVYRAQQQTIEREVAIKVILPQHANRPDFIRRFETEAQLVARLEHPYIVPLYDYWREPGGAYLVMRWLRGGSVQDAIDQNGPWTPDTTSRLLNQIAEALAVAHRQGIVHRDLKPENILLDDDGNAYLSDFGIAKDTGNGQEITQDNAIVGSPAYLSPEQIRGETLTPHSDIYALGIVLYEILTGERPFRDPIPATLMYKHLNEPLPDLTIARPELPFALNAVIQRATAKDPEVRYDDVIALARDFRHSVKPQDFEDAATRTAVASPTGEIVMPEPENPYKGLRAFQQADAADFFGREVLVESIIGRLTQAHQLGRFLAVVGPSGCGKSSVLKAGLIPALRRGAISGSQDWFTVEMVPGIDPMEELEGALLRIAVNPPESLLSQLNEDDRGLLRAVKRVLPDDNSELVLVIDQFEEAFTLVEDEAQRAHFLDSLIAAVTDRRSRLRVIITLRADFYDRPLNYNRFGDLMRQQTEIVLPLTADELENAITGPAVRAGLTVEPGLITAVVADINEQPGALPLLQYALTELFEQRKDRALTLQTYNEIGGMMGALSRRAEELYDSLSSDGQEAARQLFLRLITLGEGAEDTRRRVLQPELMSIGDDSDLITMVVEAFGRYRLLTFDRDPFTRTATVEVAHEALIRQWERLRNWLADSREHLRTQRRLTSAAEEWLASGKDPSFLARGARLAQFESWENTTDLALNRNEAEYLKASIAEHEKALTAEWTRQEREAALERRSRNFLRALAAVMTVSAFIALGLAAVALSQWEEARIAHAQAESSALEAQISAAEARSLALAANARNALNENDTTLALALAIEANKAYEPATVEVMRVLAGTAYGSGPRHRFEGHTAAVLAAAFSPDGSLSATGAADGSIRLWDNQSGELIRTLDLDEAIITGTVFSPDGAYILASTTDYNLYLFDALTGSEIRSFEGHTDMVTGVAFSMNGMTALSGSLDRTLRLWDVDTGEQIRVFEGHTGAVLDVALSPDSRYAASSSGDETIADDPNDLEDRTVRVWDIEGGDEILSFRPPGGFVRTVAFSPDSRYVLTATWNSADGGILILWDIEANQEVQRFFGHIDIITDVGFSPDGTTLFSASWDQTLRLWDARTGTAIKQFENFDDRLLAMDISADGDYVLVATGNLGNNEIEREFERSNDTSVWLMDMVSRDLVTEFFGHEDWVWSMAVSPDGRYAASGSGPLRPPEADTSVRVWEIETGAEIWRFDGHSATVEGVAFSPDGTMLLSAAWDGLVILLDVTSGEEIRRFGGERSHQLQANYVVFSPDGQTALSGGSDGIIILWDVASGEALREFVGHQDMVTGIAFSPDGRSFVTASWDHTLRLWDTETADTIRTFEGHTHRAHTVAFSPDGASILSGSWDMTVRLWDVETGQEARRFVGHNGPVQSVAFNDDGSLALSGSADTVMRLWDVLTGQELRRFDGHTNWVSGVAFVPGGRYAISSAQDNTLRLWQVPREAVEIVEWANNNRYVRELTCAEREQFRVEPLCQ